MPALTEAASLWRTCFNEAGILHPGMPLISLVPSRMHDASMRPGFYIPECPNKRAEQHGVARASMRPGFYIPECSLATRTPTS